MSDRAQEFEGTFRWVEGSREAATSAQGDMEAAYRNHFGRYFRAREDLFDQLAEKDSIEGERIVDYAEASMRLDGVDPSVASSRADQLARIFAPSPDDPALPAYFHAGRSFEDPVLAVRPAPAGEDRMTFSLDRDDSNYEVHSLYLRSEGAPNIFRNRYISLGNGGSVHWTYGRQATASVYFAGLEITDDPDKAKELKQDKRPSILIGEAAVAAIDPFEHFEHESVALASIVKGTEPDHRYDGMGRKASEETLRNVGGYATRLLKSNNAKDFKDLRGSVPVQFHPAVLHLDISQADIENATLEGIADAGSVLTEEAADLIHDRVESGTRHRNTGAIIDTAIENRLEFLKRMTDAVGVESGLTVEAESLMHAVLQNPGLYRSLALGRRGNNHLSESAHDAVWTYVRQTPRFRGL